MAGLAFCALPGIAPAVGAGGNTIYQPVPATTARWFRIEVPKDATVRDFVEQTFELERKLN